MTNQSINDANILVGVMLKEQYETHLVQGDGPIIVARGGLSRVYGWEMTTIETITL